MSKVGLITIGQSPRVDFTKDIQDLLKSSITIQEYGALDNYAKEELDAISAYNLSRNSSGESILVSRLNDGSEVSILDKDILPLVQACIYKAELEGADLVAILCTGYFPDFKHTKPLIVPRPLIFALLEHLASDKKLGILIPKKEQISAYRKCLKQTLEEYNLRLKLENIQINYASPYGDLEDVVQAALKLNRDGCQMLYLDCMGYTQEMKHKIMAESHIPCLIPRTIIVSLFNDLLS